MIKLLPHNEKCSHLLILYPIWSRSPDSFSLPLQRLPDVSLLCSLMCRLSHTVSPSPGTFTCSMVPLRCHQYTQMYPIAVPEQVFPGGRLQPSENLFPYIASGVSSSCSNLHAEELHIKLKLKERRSSTNRSEICLSVVLCLEPAAESWVTAFLSERDPVLRTENLPPSSENCSNI